MISRRSMLLALICWFGLVVSAAAGPTAVSGKIVEVDLHGRTMTVKDAKAGRVLIEVPEKAKLVLDGDDQAILEDVFNGDVVEKATVRDGGGGRLVLVSAVISSKREPRDD
ncbi:MAG: hypothetical protein U0V87_00235 [Acidobacteriota bacterium]